MQSWGWGTVPPVATGKFVEDTKVHQVSPVSTIASTEGSDDGKLTLKDRRIALEQEVAKLRKKHTQEVNLHRALERALQRPQGILPRIPSYLPAKIQKLLAEVAVLEEEVDRLEDHVVLLRQEISDETTQVSSHGAAQKQKPIISDINLSKPGNLSKIRVTKDSVKEFTKEPPKEPTSGKYSAAHHRKATTNVSNNEALQQRPKDLVREPQVSKTSSNKSFLSSSLPATSFLASDSSRRTGGKSAPTYSGPPPTRKPPAATEVLSRFQGLQPQWKPTGGTNNGKSNLFRQFNSLNWGDSKTSSVPSAAKQPAGVASPRVGIISPASTLAPNWLSSSSSVSSPRTSPRIGQTFTGTSSVRLWEKENLQSVASRLISKSPRGASKLGLSVDLSSSNVERKSTLGSKGSSAQPSSAGKLSNLSIVKEGPGRGSGPNRLSEELVRCLVAIYCKLTKATSFPSVRVSQGSRGSAQFSRGKPSNGPLTNIYGVFKDNQPQDIGYYRNAQEITAETIDSNGPGSSAALYKKLSTLIEQLEKVALDALSHHEKLAFWINIYNVCMMHAFLDHGIPSTPSKVVALMRKAVVNVGGYVLNALTIEHFILRLPCRPKNVRTSSWKHFQRAEANLAMAFLKNVGMEEIKEHSAYGLDWNEPLVTFALCCGSRSSPALRVYTSSAIESELQIAKQEYLQAAVGVSNQKKIHLPKLLEWYMRDFAKDMEGLLDWLCQQLSGPLHAAVQDCVNHPREGLLSHSVEVMPYDFNFRYLFLI
ncbi:unnamed protein product [Calypogeia fissa]